MFKEVKGEMMAKIHQIETNNEEIEITEERRNK